MKFKDDIFNKMNLSNRLIFQIFYYSYLNSKLLLFDVVESTVLPPPWANPKINPCALQPRGWQLLFWPKDGRCYKIFQMGYPCPESMELSPAVNFGQNYTAECRCPPKTAFFDEQNRCYPIFTKGPCPKGFFFGPDERKTNDTTKTKRRMGSCQKIKDCPNGVNEVFFPRYDRCYGLLTKGPCQKGLLVIKNEQDEDNTGRCDCSFDGQTKQNYYSPNKNCYEHFSKGPCREMGTIFLPDRQCGCNHLLPHFDPNTKTCYEIGSIGPCDQGERFLANNSGTNAICDCQEGYVRFESDNKCYRPLTQGPCPSNRILLNATACIPQPCKKGHLYFPKEEKCFRIGTRGPCAVGKVVAFDFDTKPAVEGVSYRGKCRCDYSRSKCDDDEKREKCADNKRKVYYNKDCYDLYKKGPCPFGAWLAIRREKRNEIRDDDDDDEGVCECMPGYKRIIRNDENVIECVSPSELFSIYLNDHQLIL